MQIVVNRKYIEYSYIDNYRKIIYIYLEEDIIRLMDEYDIKIISTFVGYSIEIDILDISKLSILNKLRYINRKKNASSSISDEAFFVGDRIMEFRLSLE